MPLKAKGSLSVKSGGSDWKGDLQRRWAQVAVVGKERYEILQEFAAANNIPETIACRVILNAGIDSLSRLQKFRTRAVELIDDRKVYHGKED